MSNAPSPPIYIDDVPNLAPAPFWKGSGVLDGQPAIILPSGHNAWHFSRFSEVRAVLADKRFLRSPSNTENGPSVFPTLTPKELLLNCDEPDHLRLRAPLRQDFSSTSVERLRGRVADVTHAQLDRLMGKGDDGDLLGECLADIPALVICDILGICPEDRTVYRPLARTVQVADEATIDDLILQFGHLYDYLGALIRKERPIKSGGLIDRLVAGRSNSDPALSDAELIGLLLGVLVGGDKNVLSTLTKTVYMLLAAPSLYRSLVENPALIPSAVNEVLRITSLGRVAAFPRVASDDIEFQGWSIPKGSAVYPDILAANRDPEVFSAPLHIRFDRDGPRHLQFGYGPHYCLGASLSFMEITTILEILTRRLPDLRLSAPAHTVPWIEGLILRRPTCLPVSWAPSL